MPRSKKHSSKPSKDKPWTVFAVAAEQVNRTVRHERDSTNCPACQVRNALNSAGTAVRIRVFGS